jgi:homoserine dehydrogenase
MKEVRTILIGLGTVNIGLLKILIDKKTQIALEYGLAFTIVAVADSSGVAINPSGFSYEELILWKTASKKVNQLDGHRAISVENIAEEVAADLLIESSAGNLKTGLPGLAIVRNALNKGVSVVLANKAPLVFAFDELHDIARSKNAGLVFSATVCGGLPVINVLRRDLKFATLKKFRGILNATTNFILHEIALGGSREEAIREAQRLGAAEADPSHDVNGHDTANKLFIIMKSFAGYRGSISDITVEGIQNADRTEILDATSDGNKIKLVATAEKRTDGWSLSVKPTLVPRDSFLGTCDKWEMGIEIETDLYESICMKNFEADPVGTSAAVLRDAVGLFIDQKVF